MLNDLRRQRGVTLIELVMAIVIAGIMLGGITTAWLSLMQRSADPLILEQTRHLANGMMNEILARPLLDPLTGRACAPPPAQRRDFDDVCDYNGYHATTITDVEGREYPEYQGYGVRVDVLRDAWGDIPAGIAWHIRVRVDNPLGEPVTLDAWRTCRAGKESCHAP